MAFPQKNTSDQSPRTFCTHRRYQVTACMDTYMVNESPVAAVTSFIASWNASALDPADIPLYGVFGAIHRTLNVKPSIPLTDSPNTANI